MNDPNHPDGTSVIDLPATVDGEIDVYVNGILQQPGIDYTRDGQTLVFPRHLEPEIKLTKLQWLLVLAGVAGTYNKHDSIDVAYRHAGRNLVATGLKPRNPATDHA